MLLCQLGARFTISISSPIIFKDVFYTSDGEGFMRSRDRTLNNDISLKGSQSILQNLTMGSILNHNQHRLFWVVNPCFRLG